MIIYKRNFECRLFSLRIVFVILMLICIFSFSKHFPILIFFSFALLSLLSVSVIKDFEVRENSLEISKFYFFGLIKRKWCFYVTEDIKVSSISADFGEEFDPPSFDAWDFPDLGCLTSVFFVFFPPKITHKKFRIETLGGSKQVLKHVAIFLNKNEYNLLKTFTSRPHNT